MFVLPVQWIPIILNQLLRITFVNLHYFNLCGANQKCPLILEVLKTGDNLNA